MNVRARVAWFACIGCFVLGAVTARTYAQIVYTTAPFTADGGAMLCDFAPPFPFQHADDLTLAATTQIGGVNWWGEYVSSNTAGFPDDFTIRIFNNVGTNPGTTPLHQFSIGHVGRTDTGVVSFGSEVYAYSATLPSSVTLSPGTYWLSIMNNTVADTDDGWYWQRAERLTGSVRSRSTDGGSWTTATGVLAFQFTAAPEPSSGLLLLSICGYTLKRRTRRCCGRR